MREGIARRAAARSRGPDLHEVRDLRIGELPARLYRPVPGPAPLVVYLHGGGWTIGSLESHDRMCRRLADGSGAAVLAIDYRLAPEHPWPASVDDTVAALRWVASGPASGQMGWDQRRPRWPWRATAPAAPSPRWAACGCATSIRRRYRICRCCSTPTPISPGPSPPCARRPPAGAWTPPRCGSSTPSGSRTRPAGLTPRSARCTLRDLSGLPGALVVSAEHDPLRDESEAYARRLRDAGVAVELRREPGLIHGFMTLDEISPACAAAADRVAADLRAKLSRP